VKDYSEVKDGNLENQRYMHAHKKAGVHTTRTDIGAVKACRDGQWKVDGIGNARTRAI
jgi:hypothetical protein